MKRYTGKIVVDTGFINCTHKGEYEFECEPEDFENTLMEWTEHVVWNSISTYTEDETEEDVEEEEE